MGGTFNGRYLGVAFSAIRAVNDWGDMEVLEYSLAVTLPPDCSVKLRTGEDTLFRPPNPVWGGVGGHVFPFIAFSYGPLILLV